jgi:hypothetical protein
LSLQARQAMRAVKSTYRFDESLLTTTTSHATLSTPLGQACQSYR